MFERGRRRVGQQFVERARKGLRALALDEFVEEIPFEETRGYVKRVLRSFAAYRLLYGATDAGPQLGILKVSAQSAAAR